MADRAHLLRLQPAAHLEHDRGRRLGLVAREQRPFGQHQMHARGCTRSMARMVRASSPSSARR